MWENITKKEFINYLEKHEHVLLFSKCGMHEKGFTKVINTLFNLETKSTIGFRKAVETRKTFIEFDNGSRVYFDTLKKCYKHNNIIISISVEYDPFDECDIYTLFAYEVR